jgi:F0F1-type ATP synthase epsilon subunit
MEGEYGVTAGHTPIISQMKPGVISIVHEAVRAIFCGVKQCGDVTLWLNRFSQGSEAEKFFVSGGFALTHADSSTVHDHSAT